MATAPKKAAPKKAAAAPAFEKGQNVKFIAYDPSVPEAEQLLQVDCVYPVVDVNPETGNPIVQFPNADFDSALKEDPKKNPLNLEVECFPDEVSVTDEEVTVFEDAGEEVETEVEPEPVADKPARASKSAKAPAATKAPAKTPAKAAAKEKAAPAAKGKAATKAAAKKAPVVVEDEAANDELEDLENEDPEVLALIEGNDDLIALAQDLEKTVGTTEYQMGGILRRILKDKSYLEVEGAEEAGYAEAGGFRVFLSQYFNIDYRKAMYLIQIYETFTIAGIENPSEVVAQLGWTKASKIAPLFGVEGQDPAELIETAGANTVADLSEIIKEQVQVGGKKTTGDKVTRVTLKFRLFEEDGASVAAILETVKEQMGFSDLNESLSYVVTEWANSNAGGEAAVEDAPTQAAPKKASAPMKRATAKA